MTARPLLGDLELDTVQRIESGEGQALVRHEVPALEGDFLQRLGRRGTRVVLSGFVTGPGSAERLGELRAKVRAAEPVAFLSDVATATRLRQVLVERLDAREVAGKPGRFEVTVALRELTEPPPAESSAEEVAGGEDSGQVQEEVEEEAAAESEERSELIRGEAGELAVELLADGVPDFDPAAFAVSVRTDGEDGTQPSTRTLAEREGPVWTARALPAGRYLAEASGPGHLVGAASADVEAGQSTQVQLGLSASPREARKVVVHFRFDSAFVEPCMRGVLKDAAEEAVLAFDHRILILGHTDESGSATYNQSLSERRARSVFAFLTFGRSDADRQAAIAEWDALRRSGGSGAKIQDSWGTREVQHMLQDLRFYPGPVDGDQGPLTRDAVRAFRCAKGLPAGDQMDDPAWLALITDYLAKSALSILDGRLFPNCEGEVIRWLGCGEQDPVLQGRQVWRPSRRAEVLFVDAETMPCEVPAPVTFHLPPPGGVGGNWCVGPAAAPPTDPARSCFLIPAAEACAGAAPELWCRRPFHDDTLTVRGVIRRELADGTLEPVARQAFRLIDPDGRFWADEGSNGEGQPARTAGESSDPDAPEAGSFEFPDLREGVYHLEVVTPVGSPVLVKPGATLDEVDDGDVRGNSVCKRLTPDDPRLDVILVRAPVMREIRLPVAVHLMTALDPASLPDNPAIRTCDQPTGEVRQASGRLRSEMVEAFRLANRIWRQGRVRWELADVVRETYTHPTAGLCEVDGDEFVFLLSRTAYDGVVNVYVFADLEGPGTAVFGVSPEDGVAEGVSGCALSDFVVLGILGVDERKRLDDQEMGPVLAHGLGLFLDLDTVEATPDNGDRLMRSISHPGQAGRELVAAEIERARGSRAATPSCLPLSLTVTGAERLGGTLSDRFAAVRSPGQVVVEAVMPPHLLQAGAGTLTLNGQPGPTLTLDRDAPATTEVTAVYTPAAGGDPTTARVVVHVTGFRLAVVGAEEQPAGSGRFVTFDHPRDLVRVDAEISHRPFAIPEDFIDWSPRLPSVDPLRRFVSKQRPREMEVSATVASVTRSVTLVVQHFELRVEGQGVRRGVEGGDEFVAALGVGFVTVVAEVAPVPDPVPPGFITWQGGEDTGDPLRRRVRRGDIARTPVRATIAGTTRRVFVTIFEVALTAHSVPLGPAVDRVQVEGLTNAALGGVRLGHVRAGQRGSLFRARASVPGREAALQSVSVSLVTREEGGAEIEDRAVTLTRTAPDSDHFLSPPILAVPHAIERTEITLTPTPAGPPELEVVRAQAGGQVRLDASGAFPLGGLGRDSAPVRGRVIHLFVQTLVGAFQGDPADASVAARETAVRGHVDGADRIWAQAGIEVETREVRIDVADPGGLLRLSTQAQGRSAEEDRLVGQHEDCDTPGRCPEHSDVATDLNVFYLLEFLNSTVAGVAYGDVEPPVLALEGPSATGPVLGHEIGHHLLTDWACEEDPQSEREHKDPSCNAWPATNVMHSQASGGTDLTAAQVDNVLESNLVLFHP